MLTTLKTSEMNHPVRIYPFKTAVDLEQDSQEEPEN